MGKKVKEKWKLPIEKTNGEGKNYNEKMKKTPVVKIMSINSEAKKKNLDSDSQEWCQFVWD